MRHRVSGRRLGRDTKHRKALRRNLMSELFRHERIKTTEAKAKAIRSQLNAGPLFTPLGETPTTQLPGWVGGAGGLLGSRGKHFVGSTGLTDTDSTLGGKGGNRIVAINSEMGFDDAAYLSSEGG